MCVCVVWCVTVASVRADNRPSGLWHMHRHPASTARRLTRAARIIAAAVAWRCHVHVLFTCCVWLVVASMA